MNTNTLRELTLETVDNYRQVAAKALGAYRTSGHRLLAVMNRSVDRAAARGTERVAPRLAAALRRTSDQVTGVAAKGIDTVSAQTGRVIELGSASVTAQVDRVAELVAGIENRYVASGLQAAARISLRGAKAALDLSEMFVAGADRLSAVVAGTATPRVAAKRVARKAVTSGRGAQAAARRATTPSAKRGKSVAAKARRTAKAAAAR